MNKLIKKVHFSLPLLIKSGLHIGGSNLSMAIGGADAVVIRDPLTQEPIIPGSSVKGKMRSLTEKLLGKFTKAGNKNAHLQNLPFTDDSKHVICKLYGTASGGEDQVPSRLIVRDAKLDRDSEKDLKNTDGTDMLYTEVKTEVVIDRVTSAATPRQLERVPAGSVFSLELVLNVFEDDDEDELVNYVKVGLRLMEDDSLGGNGSRGSGEISINWDNIVTRQKVLKDYEAGNDWQPYTNQ